MNKTKLSFKLYNDFLIIDTNLTADTWFGLGYKAIYLMNNTDIIYF